MAVPPELGALLGPLVQDKAVGCPVARFGRLILTEWEAGGRSQPINTVVGAVAESCATTEEETTLQVEQCKIARDKLASELQWVEAKQQAAVKKNQEAKEFRGFCRAVLSGMIELGGVQSFSAPAPAGTSSRQADIAPPYHHPDPSPVVSASHQHQASSRDPVAPTTTTGENADAAGGLTAEFGQLSNLLQIGDVKESTLENAVTRCEQSCLTAVEIPWVNRLEYEAAVALMSRINDHVLKPRPPLQLVEVGIQRAIHKRYLAHGRPRDSQVEFLDTLDAGDKGSITVCGMLLDSLNDEVKSEALLFLRDLLTDENSKMVFARSGALKPLVTIVGTSNNESTLDLSLIVLWTVCSQNDEIREAIRKLDGIQAVVELLYTNNVPMLENAVAALGFLTREVGSKTLMRECAGLEKLVASLYHPNENIVAKAAGVIWNCACDQENRLALKQLGAIPQLLELLKHSSDNVTENAGGALWNITAEPEYRKMMAEFNGIPALLKLLSSGKDVVVENASGTLWNCSATVEVRASIRKNKGLAELLKLLTHSRPTVQENAAGVIRNCAINDQNKLVLRELGAVELFLDLLQGCTPEIRDKLLSTLWIMTVHVENKHAVRQANGFPVLVRLLQTVQDHGLIEKLIGILRNCAMERENRAGMCQAGIVSAISGLASNKADVQKMSTGLKENIAATLWQLGQDEKVLLRKEGGINFVAMLLWDQEDVVLEQAAGAVYTLTNNEAENRNAVRDTGALERLLTLLSGSAKATGSTGSGVKPMNSFALHSVLLAIRNATGSNAINQRLGAEHGAVASLLALVKLHSQQRPVTGSAQASPDDIVRECLRCLKNIVSEKKGADEMQHHNGIQIIQDVMASRTEDDAVKKAGAMALQSLARLVRF